MEGFWVVLFAFFFRRGFEAFSIFWGAIWHFLLFVWRDFGAFPRFFLCGRFWWRSFEFFSKKFWRILLQKKRN